MSNSNETLLKTILKKVLLVDESSISDKLSRGDVDEWDSMGHLMLISEVESAFGVFIPDESLAKIRTIGDLRKALRNLGVTI